MYPIEQLFLRVLNDSKKLRKKNPNMDGRAFWQFIKNELNVLDISFEKWKPLTHPHKSLLSIEERDENGNMIEMNHFLRQHANIPINDPPTLTKIIQIALNIGQFLGSTTRNQRLSMKYNPKYQQLITYIYKKDMIGIHIPEETILHINQYLDSY